MKLPENSIGRENFVLVIVGNQEIAKDKVKDIANFDEVFYKDDPM